MSYPESATDTADCFPCPTPGTPALVSNENSLEAELADMRELQAISTRLIQEDGSNLFDAILDSALRLLRSDMASIQLFDPLKDGLELLSWRGFDPQDIQLFDWVGRNAGTSCAAALRAGRRVTIPDIEVSEYVVGTPAHLALRRCGIRAAQSTPLVSRDGTIIGMITNHWRQPHTPSESALALIDVLARQAADLIDRNRNQEHTTLLAREAEHRAKNILAAVLAIMRLTKADTMEDLKKVIVGRITALDNVHRLFVQSNWTGADLRSLIAEELAPYAKKEELEVNLVGPGTFLTRDSAQAISMALHELVTNAAKYGSLSHPGGQIRVEWDSNEVGGMTLWWKELGGPAVEEPKQNGVGTRVMDTMIQGQLKGTIMRHWSPTGLNCEIHFPQTPEGTLRGSTTN